jgi:hypothetical protein
MGQKIQIYQIYYEEKQLPNLVQNPIFVPYFNKTCTVFFENWVIKTLLEENKHHFAEYFGVASPRLLQKVPNFSIERLNKSIEGGPDVVIFNPSPATPIDPIKYANRYHPNFMRHFKTICNEIGINWTPEYYKHIVNSNHFIAKSYIYEDYFYKFLDPAIDVMVSMPGLMTDSRYFRQLPTHLVKEWGFGHYPLHTFICERLFSLFLHKNPSLNINYL